MCNIQTCKINSFIHKFYVESLQATIHVIMGFPTCNVTALFLMMLSAENDTQYQHMIKGIDYGALVKRFLQVKD